MHRSASAPPGAVLPPLRGGAVAGEPAAVGTEGVFTLDASSVSDLTALSATEVASELRKLQAVLSANRVFLEQVYATFGKSRRAFEDFVTMTSGIDDNRTSNEIFSIATERFAAEEDKLGHGSDCTMSRQQFTTALIRLANLCALINSGAAADGTKLSKQMESFIEQAKENCAPY